MANSTTLFRLQSILTNEEQGAFGPDAIVMAKATGEYRTPEIGEWYLLESGGELVGVRRIRDGNTNPKFIAKLVQVKELTRTTPRPDAYKGKTAVPISPALWGQYGRTAVVFATGRIGSVSTGQWYIDHDGSKWVGFRCPNCLVTTDLIHADLYIPITTTTYEEIESNGE